jgi:hypothetical protein
MSEFAGQVSRRSLLSKAGAAAVAAVAAGTLLNQREAKATHFTPDCIEADEIETHHLTADNGLFGVGADGFGTTGVRGVSLKSGGAGVTGQANVSGSDGVFGRGNGANRAGIIGV